MRNNNIPMAWRPEALTEVIGMAFHDEISISFSTHERPQAVSTYIFEPSDDPDQRCVVALFADNGRDEVTLFLTPAEADSLGSHLKQLAEAMHREGEKYRRATKEVV